MARDSRSRSVLGELEGFIRMVVVPGLFGALVAIFVFQILPATYKMVSMGNNFKNALPRAVNTAFNPYIKMLNGEGMIDLHLLMWPGTGFVIVAFIYVLYKGDSL